MKHEVKWSFSFADLVALKRAGCCCHRHLSAARIASTSSSHVGGHCLKCSCLELCSLVLSYWLNGSCLSMWIHCSDKTDVLPAWFLLYNVVIVLCPFLVLFLACSCSHVGKSSWFRMLLLMLHVSDQMQSSCLCPSLCRVPCMHLSRILSVMACNCLVQRDSMLHCQLSVFAFPLVLLNADLLSRSSSGQSLQSIGLYN